MSDRMIVEDPQGRIISVPSDAIPKGSKVIRPDVLPGQSENTFERFVSEAVNPAEEEITITPEGSMFNEDGHRVNANGQPITEDGKVIKEEEPPVEEADAAPDADTADEPDADAKSVKPRARRV
jgi:hypothetical protein